MPQAAGTISQAIMGNSSGVIPIGILGYGGTGRANTVFIWGVFHGATIGFQCRPDQKNADGSFEWFDVKTSGGSPVTWTNPGTSKTQPRGAFSFIGRAGAYQLTYTGLASDTLIQYEVR
jgi:hypothetical protein